MMRSGNPVLSNNTFDIARSMDSGDVMTIQGTVNKTMVLLLLLVASAAWVWGNVQGMLPFFLPVMIGALIIALVTIFKKQWAGVTAPIYALLEGMLLGILSAMFEKQYPGIVIQAVGLTFGTLLSLLLAYKSGIIKATENFKLGVVAATGAIAVFYIVAFVLSFFHITAPLIYDSGPLGIAFSLFVVVIAALNLVLDFDFIERGADSGAPKYMEWYGAFGLMVTLIWLYLEILRLLAKTRRK